MAKKSAIQKFERVKLVKNMLQKSCIKENNK